jgi:multidrug efflux system membrane fusion protein
MIPPDAADKLPVTLGLANEKPEDFSHPGRLQFADNKVDPNTGTLRVWGTFENPRRDLKPGLFIRVRMGIGDPQPTFFVAEKALGYDQGRKYLYVVKQEQKEDGTHDTVTYVPVEAGQRKYVPGVGPGDPGGVLIAVKAINKADQLKGDERIVVEGLQRIRPHMDVVAHVVPMPRAKAEGQGEASDSH